MRGALRRRFPLALPVTLAALPFLASAVSLGIRRPRLHFADDRAMIELAVRRAASGHQLLGNGTRFGWSDLGPAAFYLLAPVYRLFGQRPFAVAVGLLGLYALAAAATVILIGRRRGIPGGYLVAALVLVYLRAFGFGHLTNVWAPWEVILPLLLVCVLCAVGIAEAESAWALVAAAAVGSVLIQTKVEMIVIVPILLFGALSVRALHYGLPVLGRDGAPWRRMPALLALAATLVLWLPPLWQQATGHPGNLGEVVQFTWRGAAGRGPSGRQPGHSVAEALTALGEELSVFPFGHRAVVTSGFERTVAQTSPSAMALALGYLGFGTAVAGVARRRKDRLAFALATMSVIAMLATLAWTVHILGPVSFFLVVWASVLPVGTWLAALLLLRAPALSGALVAALAAVVSLGLVVGHAATFDYNRDRSAQVAILDGLIVHRDPPSLRGVPVRVHISTAPCWAVATGVVVDLVKAGAVVTVDPTWLAYFGNAFKGSANAPARLDLWFDQPGVAARGSAPPSATRLGTTKDIVLSQAPADRPLSAG